MSGGPTIGQIRRKIVLAAVIGAGLTIVVVGACIGGVMWLNNYLPSA